MKLPTEIFGNVIVVHAPDEVGGESTDELQSFLRMLDQHQVVLDLDNTEMLDSAGLTALLDAQDELRELDGDIKIATTNHCNRKILELTRLDQHLEIYDSVIEAVKSFV